ncbi:MAG: hypothetical protein ACI4JF_09465 [Oscillospiraceae bacterium]
MDNCERLKYNIFGAKLHYGRISPSAGHIAEIFYIAEHTDDLEFIEKEALQMLMQTGFSCFHFYGKKKEAWCSAFNEVSRKLNAGEESTAPLYVYENLCQFAAELERIKYIKPFVPCDYYLIYDDQTIYEDIKKELQLEYKI